MYWENTITCKYFPNGFLQSQIDKKKLWDHFLHCLMGGKDVSTNYLNVFFHLKILFTLYKNYNCSLSFTWKSNRLEIDAWNTQANLTIFQHLLIYCRFAESFSHPVLTERLCQTSTIKRQFTVLHDFFRTEYKITAISRNNCHNEARCCKAHEPKLVIVHIEIVPSE